MVRRQPDGEALPASLWWSCGRLSRELNRALLSARLAPLGLALRFQGAS